MSRRNAPFQGEKLELFEPNKCYSSEKVAEILELQPGSVRKWVEKRQIGVIRFAGSVRLLGSDLNEWLQYQAAAKK